MRVFKIICTLLFVALIAGSFSYVMWSISRSFNYSFFYQDMVEATVCEMVNPEYLKAQCDE